MPLTYGSVQLGYVATEGVQQESVKDPSGTDQIHTRVRLSVRAVVASNVVPAAGAETPTEVMARVRHMLLKPRQRLTYVGPDNKTYLDVEAADGSAGVAKDVANGPTPVSCDVQMVAEGSLLVRFVVEAHVTDCPGGDGPTDYLSLRWEESTSYGPDWLCVKRRAGVVILPSKADLAPDDIRGTITPGVPAGFRRERAEYALDPTGLIVRFQFEDKELMRPPPWPATRMRGQMTETTPNGARRRGEISLKLEGPKQLPPKELLNAAIRICMSRVNASGPIRADSGKMLIGAVIRESLDDDANSVELHLSWQMKPVTGREKGSENDPLPPFWQGIVGIPPGLLDLIPPPQPNAQGRDAAGLPGGYANWLGKSLPGSDPTRGIAPPTRGTAETVRLVAAVLNDPCAQTAELRGGTGNELVGTDPDGGSVLVGTSDLLSAQPDDRAALYSEYDLPGVFDHIVLTSHYHDDPGASVCPSTKAGEPSQKVRLHNGQASLRVDWAMTRTGGRIVVPDPKPPSDSTWVYVGGTYSIEGVELGGDGVSVKQSASGVFYFEALDRSKVDMVAPIPPFLSDAVAPEARKVASLLGADMIFYGGDRANPTPDNRAGTDSVSRGGTAELRGGGPPVNP